MIRVRRFFGIGLALLLSVAAGCLGAPAWAEITIDNPYARASGPTARAGAVFMIIHNNGETDDRLLSVTSDASARVELHAHVDQGNGVMRMMEVEDGLSIPAGGMHALKRGGDHVMFMGLSGPWEQGDMIPLTLTFEKAGEISVEIPVDLTRKPVMDHGGQNHGNISSGG